MITNIQILLRGTSYFVTSGKNINKRKYGNWLKLMEIDQ
jgi:hypothetical protein